MPVDGDFGDEPSEPVDRLVIALRAYVRKAPKKPKKGSKPPRTTLPGAVNWRDLTPRTTPSDWVLVFDCETRTTPDQRLRFGGYQLRYKGEISERGAFYEPDVLTEDELTILRQFKAEEESNSDGERIRLRTRAEFVDEVFYQSGQAVGAQIVGFNLPFDLSRLAIRHASARRSMKGGFSLTLSENWPPVVVKHLSQRAALIRFTGDRPAAEEESEDGSDAETPDETDEKIGPDRGYFVDVKTLAAALTSRSHSLASLSELLKVPTPKKESDEHGGALTPEYIRYGLRDVQTTWECFDHLARRFASFGLNETGLYELYSEASLGKAYLRAMGIKPWQEVQRGFPLHLVGAIMSAYFGGRAEVHIRRQITPVVHTDFLSMYPTVCTLMGLWSFVRAKGMTHHDDTNAVTAFVARPREELVEHLRKKDGWKDLASLVQVRPRNNLFPVRAKYPGGDTLNIGLNYLSADEPQWFTLADVLASKILTGRTPELVRAVRFRPKGTQKGLKPVDIAGQTVNPATDDFYQRLIIHMNAIKAKLETASKTEKPALKSDEQAIKILANATSYGIFVELNVGEYVKTERMVSRPGACWHYRAWAFSFSRGRRDDRSPGGKAGIHSQRRRGADGGGFARSGGETGGPDLRRQYGRLFDRLLASGRKRAGRRGSRPWNMVTRADDGTGAHRKPPWRYRRNLQRRFICSDACSHRRATRTCVARGSRLLRPQADDGCRRARRDERRSDAIGRGAYSRTYRQCTRRLSALDRTLRQHDLPSGSDRRHRRASPRIGAPIWLRRVYRARVRAILRRAPRVRLRAL
jgi:hypothetical protein